MGSGDHIWVIDDDKSIRWVLEKTLQKAEIKATCFSSAVGLLETLKTKTPDAILTDVRMPGINGLELLRQLQIQHPELPVIIMTAHSDLENAVSAFHEGAFEYLPKPFDLNEAVALVRRACSHGKENTLKQIADDTTVANSKAIPEIIGEAPAMQEVFRAIGRLARSQITVLINGESGTGKELIAKALHRHSPRSDKPFIALNMAAIPRDLLESELFGHERGAFTGAHNRRVGHFEQANGGTLFMDEIGDMPAELQTRLLRVLADGEYYPVGAHNPIKGDVRIIAATHQDLEKLVATGRFREDLFHRLNVIRIHIPPLRERRQDIPLLLKYFLHVANAELEMEAQTLLPEAEAHLCTLDWPGNVRQLENSCRWLAVMSSGQAIHLHDLPPELESDKTEAPNSDSEGWELSFRSWVESRLLQGDAYIAKHAMTSFETILIETALRFTRGRRQEAAKLLGYGRNTLTRKIKDLDLDI